MLSSDADDENNNCTDHDSSEDDSNAAAKESEQAITINVTEPSNVSIPSMSKPETFSDTDPVDSCVPTCITSDDVVGLLEQLYDKSQKVHSRYICSKNSCSTISIDEKLRFQPKTFNHNKLNDYWWLCYVEQEGMYCIICRKHNMTSSTNKKDVFVRTPSTRFLNDSLKCHSASSVHKNDIQTELVHKMSYFYSEIVQKDKVEISLYEQVFATTYFIMKHFISNRLLIPLLTFVVKTFDCSNLRFFAHKSQGSQREIFLTVGSTVMDSFLEKARKAATFGILTDEVADISVTENLVTFIQFYDIESRTVITSFLRCQDILQNNTSANADAISTLIIDLLESHVLDLARI